MHQALQKRNITEVQKRHRLFLKLIPALSTWPLILQLKHCVSFIQNAIGCPRNKFDSPWPGCYFPRDLPCILYCLSVRRATSVKMGHPCEWFYIALKKRLLSIRMVCYLQKIEIEITLFPENKNHKGCSLDLRYRNAGRMIMLRGPLAYVICSLHISNVHLY